MLRKLLNRNRNRNKKKKKGEQSGHELLFLEGLNEERKVGDLNEEKKDDFLAPVRASSLQHPVPSSESSNKTVTLLLPNGKKEEIPVFEVDYAAFDLLRASARIKGTHLKFFDALESRAVPVSLLEGCSEAGEFFRPFFS